MSRLPAFVSLSLACAIACIVFSGCSDTSSDDRPIRMIAPVGKVPQAGPVMPGANSSEKSTPLAPEADVFREGAFDYYNQPDLPKKIILGDQPVDFESPKRIEPAVPAVTKV
jgi:hypothetical protein